ncbi:MFS transporter [Acidipropionibacterium acidipropionici]|nr:MFS transporter [Acidipropionibacterium acidipropionici]ALN14640.1 MFS transporter [Acidipropionibacterium acidipropionici]APZ09603.1 MFS transporter [Acidipropionibacterium acidipropionici]
MAFSEGLRRLWRLPRFRRILGVRVSTQAADGTLQTGLASYVLLSPEQQPDAWSIAMVLAITMLPFSIIGPFISLTLDRWPRQRILVGTDGLRCIIALAVAALVWDGARQNPAHLTLLFLLLIAMSLNRYLLAALTAGLEHTIDRREYLTASSIMPVIGPLGLMIGVVVAAAVRLVGGHWMPVHHADTIIFCISAVLFAFSAFLGTRFGRDELGPTVPDPSRSASQVLHGIIDGFRHLGTLPVVRSGLVLVGFQRLLFGVYSVAMMLGYRNYFHAKADVNGAMGDMAVWGVVMGAGFVLSAGFMPRVVRAMGMRRALIAMMLATGVIQVFPGAMLNRWGLLVASFLVGLFAQSVKAGVDTICQAHIDDAYKGRIFIVYDMIYNALYVGGAAVAALVLPVHGISHPHLIGLAVAYLLVGVLFAILSGRQESSLYDRGTAVH